MTLCCVSVRATEAWVATDSLSYCMSGNVLHEGDRACVQTKLIVMSHAGYVALVRGNSVLMTWLFGELYRLRDIDAAIDALPRLLRNAGKVLNLECRAKGSVFPGNGVHLVGYSPSRGHMVRAVAESDNAFEDVGYLIVHGSADPNLSSGAFDPWVPGAFMPGGIDEFIQFARLQVLTAREDRPWAPFGGELVLVDIRPDSMTITRPCDLGLPSPKLVTSPTPAAEATFALQDNAATAPITAFTATMLGSNPVPNNEEYEVQSLTVALTGAAIQISASVDVQYFIQNTVYRIRLTEDGNTIYTSPDAQQSVISGSQYSHAATPGIQRAPSAGNHTYKLYVYVVQTSGGGGGLGFANRSIQVLELKK